MTQSADILLNWPEALHKKLEERKHHATILEHTRHNRKLSRTPTVLFPPKIDFVRKEIFQHNVKISKKDQRYNTIARHFGSTNRHLIDNFITSEFMASCPAYIKSPLVETAVMNFLNSLEKIAVSPRPQHRDLVSISQVSKARKFGEIFDMIRIALDGKVPLYRITADPIGLDRYGFSTAELKDALSSDEITGENTVSKRTAMKLIGCAKSGLATLIATRLIDPIHKGKGRKGRITRHSIDEFNENYTLSSTLAAVFGTTSHAVSEALKAEGVERVTVADGKKTPIIFERQRVERVLTRLERRLHASNATKKK